MANASSLVLIIKFAVVKRRNLSGWMNSPIVSGFFLPPKYLVGLRHLVKYGKTFFQMLMLVTPVFYV